ncbi:MAG: ABC transporter ATP-binding protein [Stackebrandtia sp.]
MTKPQTAALEVAGLGKRFGRRWVLRDCDFTVPGGSVCALVGPNGVGKTTLMNIVAGLHRPDAGGITVLGSAAGNRVGIPDGVSFMAQDRPMYRDFKVAEMVRAAAVMNPGFDTRYAEQLVGQAEIAADQKIGRLSGGEQARVALALALGKRPRLLILDEPMSNLDPLARRQVMGAVMREVTDTDMTVLLTSHVLVDIETVADHLVILEGGRVGLEGNIEALISEHHLAVGPAGDVDVGSATTVEARHTGRQSTLLLRGERPVLPGWEVSAPDLEEVVLAYLRRDAGRTRQEAAA